MLPEIGDAHVLKRVRRLPALWPVSGRLRTRFEALPGKAASPVVIGLLPAGVFAHRFGLAMRLTGKDSFRRERNPSAKGYRLGPSPPGFPAGFNDQTHRG